MINNDNALIFSSLEPSERQYEKFRAFLREKYNKEIDVAWIFTEELNKGFRLQVENDVYDWSPEGRLSQFKEALSSVSLSDGNIITLLKEKLDEFSLKALPLELGIVKSVGDGIAKVSGLEGATYGEILLFENGIKGMVLSLTEDYAGCVLFDDDEEIKSGSKVRRTGKTAGIPVGDAFLGRVVNSLGTPIDGKGEINPSGYRLIENPAPSIVDRAPVNTPLETGILSIDSMFPIGRGQRELIIGDRQTGKTAIAIDTIINQKGKNCICIYVAIGQKASSVARIVSVLEEHDALEYSVIVAANASDSDPLLYIAPYAGCAIGEYFMEQGKDVLIVYDDLSKHAVSYRTLSLLLDRAPGREAYPGDVFYLHSRLLERSAKLNSNKGGGSITALPIVETQAGDVSAYIPTNIISITDGQIFLESDLFFAGQRPAVNVGLSVSRVGGDAQTKAMKKAVGTLRLELAQYREMEVFTQFASDLDDATRSQLNFGQSLMRMLRQDQLKPYSLPEQVCILLAGLNHVYDEIPDDEINDFIQKLIEHLRLSISDVFMEILSTGLLSDENKEKIISESKKAGLEYIEKKGTLVG